MAQPTQNTINKPAVTPGVRGGATVPALALSRPRRDIVETVWSLFCSVRFAVVLNVGLALAAMLGTVIPQLPAGISNLPTELGQFLDGARGRYGDLSGPLYWAGFFDIY